MANTRKKDDGKSGTAMARTWAITYRSAWVASADVMEFPGIFSDYVTFQSCERAMNRAGIHLDRQPLTERAFLYRLSPETVREILGE